MNNEKASNFETKSLLYLIGQRKDSKDVLYVTFDCFNDVSGVNKKLDKIWDIQSKNEKSLTPKKIGEYFFTLFDNSISIFSFEAFIFFCPKLKDDYKLDKTKTNYDFDNIADKTQIRVKNGLIDKVISAKGTADLTKIDAFLKKILIVEDSLSENEYIKSITKFKNKELKPDLFYENLFKDLRDIQTTKKNSYIENNTIAEIKEVLNFKRHLSTKDIETLIISRIVGSEIFGLKSIPIHFLESTKGLEIEDVKDLLQDCNSNLSRAFFNKNSNKVFWDVCEKIIEDLEKNPTLRVEDLYDKLFTHYNFKVSYLNKITILYLVAIIKEGIE